MPYVRCQRCGLTSFSAAQWSGVDHGSGCNAELPCDTRGERRRWPPDVESEVREHLYGLPGRRAAVDLLDRWTGRRA